MKRIPKRIRKSFFSLANVLPKPWRDGIYRSRLNFQPLPEGVILELARNRSDLDAAFQLLHEAYVKEGFSKPHDSGRRVTDYHILPSTSTLVAKYQGQVVGTISIIRDGAFGLPMDKITDLQQFRQAGERLGEVSSLAVSPTYRGNSGVIMFHMFKYVVDYCLNYFGVDRMVIVINPARKALYESLLIFTRLQRRVVKSYQFVNNAPGLCMTLNLRTLDQTWGQAYKEKPAEKNLYRFFFYTYTPREAKQVLLPERTFHTIEDPVMTPDRMDFFFKQCTDGLCGLSERQILILHNIYNEPCYASVWPINAGTKWRDQRRHRRFDVSCFGLANDRNPSTLKLRVVDASRSGLRVISEGSMATDNCLPTATLRRGSVMPAMDP
ncbi:MAG: GNAT family N-acetyltransferase, partial [Desulfatitalea sp.]|nr:GNAT family N-acetyltransferase [Desulfatitalea sp.]NNJ98863.1 GNAT family N-acetyltransferase [Desulfatitalea sp.]